MWRHLNARKPFSGLGSPRPTRGAYSAPPDPLAMAGRGLAAVAKGVRSQRFLPWRCPRGREQSSMTPTLPAIVSNGIHEILAQCCGMGLSSATALRRLGFYLN